MADKINFLLSNENERMNYATNALFTVIQDYNISKMSVGFFQAIKYVMEK